MATMFGCSYKPSKPPGYVLVEPTPIDQASAEIPEDQLLDVGVEICQVEELPDKHMEQLGTNEDIRNSERHFVPYHLKNTLQSSSHWGAVQVVPPENDAVDLKITAELVRSNGEVLQVKVEAFDASGRKWLSRKYHAEARVDDYDNTVPGSHEAYQDFYNVVANELAAFQRELTPEQIEEIRTVSHLKFARDFAPEVYESYIIESEDGDAYIERLPSDDDPMMVRIELIRERENMFMDTLNLYYEDFYLDMWEAYENWRRFNMAEQIARREVEREAVLRTIGGVLMIAAAIALQVGDISGTGALSGMMLLGGGQIMVGGINISQQTDIHAEAIAELGESFGAEMRPTVVELEGKQYELTGTAGEQYERWRMLLRQIYYEETGFAPPESAENSTSGAMPDES